MCKVSTKMYQDASFNLCKSLRQQFNIVWVTVLKHVGQHYITNDKLNYWFTNVTVIFPTNCRGMALLVGTILSAAGSSQVPG